MAGIVPRLLYFGKRCLGYFGPGYLIAIGYMDPGNWQTDIESGSTYNYRLLWVILLSNGMAMILQYLAIRLGVLGRLDLARACALRFDANHQKIIDWRRRYLYGCVKWGLYLLAELAMMATDLAEVIGTAIALKMLFGLPLLYGVLLTALDVLLLLTGLLDTGYVSPNGQLDPVTLDTTLMDKASINNPIFSGSVRNAAFLASSALSPPSQRRHRWRGAKVLELVILCLMTLIAACFLALMILIRPSFIGILQGLFMPDVVLLVRDSRALFLALGIVGATVMPHNLYLHSSLVQARIPRELERVRQRQSARPVQSPQRASQLYHTALQNVLKYATIDSSVALSLAFCINAAILVTAAGGLHGHGAHQVENIMDAGALLAKHVGPSACILFAVALLACGQSSTLTGTLAGQIVFEGFLQLAIPPWLRRLLTRAVAILPPIFVTLFVGEDALHELLLISQVILAFQLPFAILPLIWFNCDSAFLLAQNHQGVLLSQREDAFLSKNDILQSQKDALLHKETPMDTVMMMDISKPSTEAVVPQRPRLHKAILALSLAIAAVIIGLNALYLLRLALVGSPAV
jgi:manganese transport protein